jgi:hypothetical protein
MGEDQGQERTQLSGDPDQRAAVLHAEIETVREDLGDTAAALAAKTDVKARARTKLDDVKENPVPVAAAGGALLAGIVLWGLARRRS